MKTKNIKNVIENLKLRINVIDVFLKNNRTKLKYETKINNRVHIMNRIEISLEEKSFLEKQINLLESW